jgi:transposase InsO family protein
MGTIDCRRVDRKQKHDRNADDGEGETVKTSPTCPVCGDNVSEVQQLPDHTELRPCGHSVAGTIDGTLTVRVGNDSPFRRGPLTGLSDVEAITADWVHWYNTSRLMHRLDRRPPAEAEADYHAQTRNDRSGVHT